MAPILILLALGASGPSEAGRSPPPEATASERASGGRDPVRADEAENVRGTTLATCSKDPMTGFYRDGRCATGPEDRGTHVVCAVMTAEFLAFTRARGNDLITPSPRHRFPGLEPGDRWCLCALRWREALEAGRAPPVVLDATEATALRYVGAAELEARSEARSTTED